MQNYIDFLSRGVNYDDNIATMSRVFGDTLDNPRKCSNFVFEFPIVS
jgi:hypothetical protein